MTPHITEDELAELDLIPVSELPSDAIVKYAAFWVDPISIIDADVIE